MLSEEQFHLFTEFRIGAMGAKLREIVDDESYDGLTFEEKIEMMLDAEIEARRDRKVEKLTKAANFKQSDACIEDVIYLQERSIKKDRILRYAECRWVEDNEVLILISKSGCGKSFLAQSLGNAACRKLHSVRYARLIDIIEDLKRAREDGAHAYYERLAGYKTVKMLIIDDFMTTPSLDAQGAIDLFEIMEAREGTASTLIASQLEPDEWYLRIEGQLMVSAKTPASFNSA